MKQGVKVEKGVLEIKIVLKSESEKLAKNEK